MIPLIKPFVGDDEIVAVSRVLRSGWLTQGQEVQEFEREFAEYTGAQYACALSNCTTALHLALISLGVTKGEEVIVPSHTYIATVNAITYVGAIPVFVDIELSTYNLNVEQVRAALTPRTKAIIAVHQMGLPCDVGRLRTLADSAGVALIEDAACAIGSEVEVQGVFYKVGKPVGDVACFSFHPRKILTTGDGGMLTTNSEAIAERVRSLRSHAMSISSLSRHQESTVKFENYAEVGYNYRLTDIQAAVGRVQLSRIAEIVASRRRMASVYSALLRGTDIVVPSEPAWARTNWQSYCVRLPRDTDQAQVMQSLLNDGVSTRRGIMCVHREPPYVAVEKGLSLLNSELAQDSCLILPLYEGLQVCDQEYVVNRLLNSITSLTS